VRRLSIAFAVAFAWLALPASAPAQTALTPEQFAAIDNVYVAFAEFNDANGATPADRVAARAACTGLGSSVAWLSALRRACNAQLRVGPALAAAARCRGRTSCLLTVRRVRIALSDLIVVARASNRAITAVGFAPACQRELRADLATLRFYTRLRDGFAQLERAIRIRSPRLAARAGRRIDALKAPDTRSSAEQRADYLAGCALPA
jgi:hypothetical protein